MSAFEAVEVIGVAIARRLRELEVRKPPEQDGERDAHFEPRQRRADAEMDAAAERDMIVGRPREIEPAGLGEDGGIAIGGAEQQADPVALAQPHAVDLDVLQRRSG